MHKNIINGKEAIKGNMKLIKADKNDNQLDIMQTYEDICNKLKKESDKTAIGKITNAVTSLRGNIVFTAIILTSCIVPVIYNSVKPEDRNNAMSQAFLMLSSILQIGYGFGGTILRTKGSARDIERLFNACKSVLSDMQLEKKDKEKLISYAKDQVSQHKKITMMAYLAASIRVLFLSSPLLIAKNVPNDYKKIILGSFIVGNHMAVNPITALELKSGSRMLQKGGNISSMMQDISEKKYDVIDNQEKSICTKKFAAIFGANLITATACSVFTTIITASFLENLQSVSSYNQSQPYNSSSFSNITDECMTEDQNAQFLRGVFCAQNMLSTILMFGVQGMMRVTTSILLASKNKRACTVVAVNGLRYGINTGILSISAVLGDKYLVPELSGISMALTTTIVNIIENVMYKPSSNKHKKDEKIDVNEEDILLEDVEKSINITIDCASDEANEGLNKEKNNFFARIVQYFGFDGNKVSVMDAKQEIEKNCSDDDFFVQSPSTEVECLGSNAIARLNKSTSAVLTIM